MIQTVLLGSYSLHLGSSARNVSISLMRVNTCIQLFRPNHAFTWAGDSRIGRCLMTCRRTQERASHSLGVLRIPGNGSAVSVWEQARWRGRDETGMKNHACDPHHLSIPPLMGSLSLAAKGVISVTVTERNTCIFDLPQPIADMGRRYPCRGLFRRVLGSGRYACRWLSIWLRQTAATQVSIPDPYLLQEIFPDAHGLSRALVVDSQPRSALPMHENPHQALFRCLRWTIHLVGLGSGSHITCAWLRDAS